MHSWKLKLKNTEPFKNHSKSKILRYKSTKYVQDLYAEYADERNFKNF